MEMHESNQETETSETVLVVDDDARVRQTFSRHLALAGYTVLTASGGEEAIQIFEQERPDVMLVDVRMPRVDGFEVLRAIRERNLEAEVILVTGHGDMETAIAALHAGASDFIPKPVEKETLDTALWRARERLRLKRELDAAESRLRLQSAALEAAANTIVITDREGDITWTNPAFTRLTGYTVAEALGQNPRVLKSGKHDPSFYQHLWDTITSGQVWHSELVNKRKDGSLYTEEMTITPMQDARGEIAHFIAIKQDVTERKRAEEALAWESSVNAAIAELSRALISLASLEDISSLVLEQAKRLTSSEFGFVGYIDPQTGHFVSATLTQDIWEGCQVTDKAAVFGEFKGLWGWVLDNREPLLTNNPEDDPRSSGIPPGHVPIQRFLSAPAMLGEALVGQVALANPDRDYTERDLALVERLASLYALAVQRKRAEESLRQYADEQTALYAVASATATSLDPDELLFIILDVVLPVLDSDAGWVTLPGPTLDDPPHIAAWRNVPESFLAAETSRPLRNCPVCAPLLAGEEACKDPMVCVDCPRLSPEIITGAGLHSHVGIPLAAGERVLGVLNVGWQAPHLYTEADHALLVSIGQQVGLTLHNAQLYQAARQVDRLEALNTISAAASSSLELDTVLHRILELTCQSLSADEGSILLNDPDTGDSSTGSGQGLFFAVTLADETSGLRGQRLAPGQGIAGWSVEHNQAARVNDARQDPRYYDGIEQITGLGIHSLLCAPLSHHDKVTGVIEVVNRRVGEFTDDDLSLLEAVSSIAAAALENARLYASMRARGDELKLLNEIGLALTSTLDYSLVVHAALSQVQRFFRAENVFLLQSDPQTGEMYFVKALVEGVPVEISARLPVEQSVAGWAVEHHQPVLIDDVQSDPRFSNWVDYVDSPTRTLMAVPLLAREHVIGVIQVASTEPGAYTRDELRTLQALASTLAVALENASLYDELKTLLREREEAQAQLIHAEKMSALGRLTASIAHEINNPLQAVQGCLTLAEEEINERQRKEKLERYLDIAGSEIGRVATIVRRMRDFYRPVGTGMQPTDLHEILESVLALTDKQLQHNDVTVEQEWAEGLTEIEANPDHLKQVFLNLVLNAIDAMPEGGTVRIRTQSTRLPPGNLPAVRIEFSDTGVGMPPETQARLFEPFFTTKEQGSGLGLSISYGIIESHNGEITVTSQMGKGTTFSILLPVEQPGNESVS